ncbi:hypothetical protein NDU88_006415 [Pleurodeles waltl]|uniref:Uncharacterized protein n=1 Tax=Pleurodeles waltl TaxID=8319 RepID=A0AAV7VMQ0_PLEWA|nr:hypothetical protein NDU88_006415 [Pleurodeles waltl]
MSAHHSTTGTAHSTLHASRAAAGMPRLRVAPRLERGTDSLLLDTAPTMSTLDTVFPQVLILRDAAPVKIDPVSEEKLQFYVMHCNEQRDRCLRDAISIAISLYRTHLEHFRIGLYGVRQTLNISVLPSRECDKVNISVGLYGVR